MKKGKVFLVGTGPGNHKLITVKGLECIQKADVIVYDCSVNSRLLQYAKEEAEFIYSRDIEVRDGVSGGHLTQVLLEKAKQGKMVARLQGDSPFSYGQVAGEAAALAEAGIDFEIVPGISAALAVPAYAGIPVAGQKNALAIAMVNGTAEDVHLVDLARTVDTIVFYLDPTHLPYIRERLLKGGIDKDTPVALIQKGSTIDQVTCTGALENILEFIRDMRFHSPAIMVVGDAVRSRAKLSWFERKPLFGKRILVTRSRSQASALSEKIEEMGGEAVEFPTIRTVETARRHELDEALHRLHTFDWVIFTSVNGVHFFFKRMRELGIDIRAMRGELAAVGPKTAEALVEKGLNVSVLPGEFVAESLLSALAGRMRKGQTVLLPRANIAREWLPKELKALGMYVTEVDAYDTVVSDENADEVIKLLKVRKIDIITFSSSSTVKNFVSILKEKGEDAAGLLKGVKIACIGPITAKTAEEMGIHVDRTAEKYTIPGLIDAILNL